MIVSRSAIAAICSAKSSSEIGSRLRLIRSLTRSRCGLVYVPTVRPLATSSREIICAVDPLPFVPVRWITGAACCGSPIAAHSAAIVSVDGDVDAPRLLVGRVLVEICERVVVGHGSLRLRPLGRRAQEAALR
jgi:hypothetical protein